MKDQLTKADVTPEVKAAVVELIARRTVAEVTRECVDEVQREVLAEIPLYDDLRAHHEEREVVRIYEPDRAYLCEDEAALATFYEAVDARLRERNIKPADMEPDYCPALVAEHEQTKAEWALLDAATGMLGLDFDGRELNHRLLCRTGLEGRQQMLDLLCKIVVNL